jgi:hypothetical protein
MCGRFDDFTDIGYLSGKSGQPTGGEKTRLAGPRLNERGMSAFAAVAARRPLDGWSVDQLWSSLATVSIQSTTSSVSCVSPSTEGPVHH